MLPPLRKFDQPEHRWKPFRATTQAGTKIEGTICSHRKAGGMCGALHVCKVNDRETSQILLGMPEIPYLDERPLEATSFHSGAVFTEKLDGTAVICNLLEVEKGRFELIIRTRGVPVLFNNAHRPWRQMVARVADHDAIKRACLQHKATLVFELYGSENRHAVDYDQKLSLALHTMIAGRRGVLRRETVSHCAKTYGFQAAPIVAACKADKRDVERLAKEIASKYESENDTDIGRFRREGVVLSLERPSTAQLWKIKPPSMEEFHRISRRKSMSITLRHLFFKLSEESPEVLLDDAYDAATAEFGYVPDRRHFESEFRDWDYLMHHHRELTTTKV